MPASPLATILIFTAGFGDGHNAAARNVAAALEQAAPGRVRVEILDLFNEAMPKTGAFLRWGYVFLSTHFPAGWRWLYHVTEDMEPPNIGWNALASMHRRLSMHLAAKRPAATISTYPLYPHLLAQGHPGIPLPRKNFVVVTDSITIHSSWYKAPADTFFVTDEFSRDFLMGNGILAENIVATGFAVSPIFQTLTPRAVEAAAAGPRVLYFATAGKRAVRATLEGLLRDLPQNAHLTVVMGRHEQRLGKTVRQVFSRYGQRSGEMLGWTREVPQLLVSHDVVVTKGGGGTTHECFAAATPALVNYVIPGQEEGNAQLLEKRGCGWFREETEQLGKILAELFTSGQWRERKLAMLAQRATMGAWHIAQDILAKTEI